MKKLSYAVILVITTVIISFFSLSSCSKLPEPPTTSITQTIAARPELSLLNLLLTKTGYTQLINNSPSVTVFAPDNTAFTQFGFTEEVINKLATDSMGLDSLRVILGYHLTGQAIPKYKIPAASQLETLLGAYLFTSNTTAGVAINTMYLQGDYIPTANGVIYPIHQVLTPTLLSLQDHVATDTSLSLFAAAIAKDSLTLLSSTTTFYTLFAPVNNAFRAAGIHTSADWNNLTKDSIHTLLLYHIFSNSHLLTTDFVNTARIKSLADSTIQLGTQPFTVLPVYHQNSDFVTITTKDTIAFNGVIHHINKLLIPAP